MLVRLLVREGAEIRVIMTPAAKEFITPLSMATLSKYPVLVEFSNPENGSWNSHVSLGVWADALLIAPATANTIAGMAAGTAGNLLLATCLSARCPVFVAPAMDVDMFRHPSTVRNLKTLREQGIHVIEPSSGELASGLDGKGRMEEPETIVRWLSGRLIPDDCRGKKALVTAGPTHEPIDPVRFVSNYSSGKMGYALADELARRGAEVLLVSGPVELTPQHPSVKRINVRTAEEMYRASVELFPECDAAVMAAAVADFTPATTLSRKIKDKQNMMLPLLPTKDIAAALGKMKRAGQVVAGFALETDNETENAVKKLNDKHLDFIVVNSLNDPGAGFGYDTNKITIHDAQGNTQHFDLKNKTDVAKDIIDKLVTYFHEKDK
jgi:phosphopantothenoylcysteine decarboxylase/phosphopantothenate--cysteine ligase